jgi:hypothetical protein
METEKSLTNARLYLTELLSSGVAASLEVFHNPNHHSGCSDLALIVVPLNNPDIPPLSFLAECVAEMVRCGYIKASQVECEAVESLALTGNTGPNFN